MTIAEELKAWISTEVLEGADVGLDESTPLLELGLLDSITILRLQNFASARFGVKIPPRQLTPQNLGSIRALADLIAGLEQPAS